MNRVSLILALVGTLACSAHAQVLAPINPSKKADVNGQVLDMKALSQPTIAPSRYPTKSAEISGRRQPMSAAQTNVRSLRLVQPGLHPTGTVPHQNFGAKRASGMDRRVATTPQPRTAAPITDRTIRTGTPSGQAELADQLNMRR